MYQERCGTCLHTRNILEENLHHLAGYCSAGSPVASLALAAAKQPCGSLPGHHSRQPALNELTHLVELTRHSGWSWLRLTRTSTRLHIPAGALAQLHQLHGMQQCKQLTHLMCESGLPTSL